MKWIFDTEKTLRDVSTNLESIDEVSGENCDPRLKAINKKIDTLYQEVEAVIDEITTLRIQKGISKRETVHV